jgi:tRNA-dihydrouridine synthase B
MRGHLASLHDFYGEFMGVRIARKYMGWYLQSSGLDNSLRTDFNRLQDAHEQLHFINRIASTDKQEVLAA